MNPLFKTSSYQKGTALAVGATFVWKLVSFLNALLLAAYFGATYKTDVYFYLMMVLGFGIAFIQRLNQTVLIPEAMFLQAQNPAAARRFLTMWLYIYAGAGLVVGVLGSWFAVPGWGLFSRFGTEELTRQHTLLVLGAWWFGWQLLVYYLHAIAEMFKYFAAAWLGVLNAIGPLICLLLLGKQLGLASMLYGFIAATVLQTVVLLALCKKELGFSFRPGWHPISVRARQNMLAGQSLAVLDILNSLLPVYLMSGLGAGVITALNYCRQFTDSTTEIFTARTANIAKIELTENAARHQADAFNHTFLNAARLLAAILAPLAVFACYFAPQIVALFFQRGQFTPEAARQTVLFLRPMLFVVLWAAPGYLQNSALAACCKIKESFPYALTAGFVFTGLVIGCLPHLGAFSYPYILGAGLLVGFICNKILFQKQLPFVTYARPFWITARLTIQAAGALLPAVGLARWLPPVPWLQISLCGTVFVLLYGGILYVSPDGKALRKLFSRNV